MRMLAIVLICSVTLLAVPAFAAGQGTPQQQARAVVEKLDATLLDVMQHAQQLGYAGRYQQLQPVVTRVFNFPQVARLSVGSYWSKFNAAQQKAFVQAFRRLSIGQYASRFKGYDGESFKVLGVAKIPGNAVLVRTELVRPKGEAVSLDYALRTDQQGHWRIVNVIAKGVSSLALKRGQYTDVLGKQGVDAFIQRMQAKAAGLPQT